MLPMPKSCALFHKNGIIQEDGSVCVFQDGSKPTNFVELWECMEKEVGCTNIRLHMTASQSLVEWAVLPVTLLRTVSPSTPNTDGCIPLFLALAAHENIAQEH